MISIIPVSNQCIVSVIIEIKLNISKNKMGFSFIFIYFSYFHLFYTLSNNNFLSAYFIFFKTTGDFYLYRYYTLILCRSSQIYFFTRTILAICHHQAQSFLTKGHGNLLVALFSLLINRCCSYRWDWCSCYKCDLVFFQEGRHSSKSQKKKWFILTLLKKKKKGLYLHF